MKHHAMTYVVASAVLSAGPVGCSHTAKGAAIGGAAGGAVGAGVGAAAGGDGKSAAIGAILGAVVGGAAGAAIGREMDRRAEQIDRDLEGATVKRVGEGILITFDSGIFFAVDKSDLRPAAAANVRSLKEVLARYEDTDVLVVGHTDSTGETDYNLNLSRQRAHAVADYLKANGIAARRVRVQGEGETAPVADNGTPSGRQLNRRVEIAVFANDKLRKAAERKAS